MKRTIFILLLLLALAAGVIYYLLNKRPSELSLTGTVTTDEVIVSSEIQGRLQQLTVKEDDTVTNGELLGVIQPQEQQADVAYFASSEQQYSAQSAQAKADLENALLNFKREEDLFHQDAESKQAYDSARTAYDAAKARLDAASRQAQAATAQKQKASVQLGYTKIRAPIGGIVDTRAALQGEVVNPGQAIVTLINPDDLWVRADVEESYIDSIQFGQKLQVQLPSGEIREGEVFFKGVEADYATQRDVSRTKRDIKTFAIKVSLPNSDRRLFTGMTATVLLPSTNNKKSWFARL